jgi:hypothetical protein
MRTTKQRRITVVGYTYGLPGFVWSASLYRVQTNQMQNANKDGLGFYFAEESSFGMHVDSEYLTRRSLAFSIKFILERW